jgi:mannose-6-phosphate isomerase-like protein (cupin superfamily)
MSCIARNAMLALLCSCREVESRRYQTETAMSIEKVNLAEKLVRITEHWRPKVVGELNGQEVKLVKIQGEFVWHHHQNEDELFLIIRGSLRLEFRDRVVQLEPGEMVVVPKGVEHRPVAKEEVELMLFVPAATRNTGNVVHPELTAPDGVRV